MVLTLVHAQPDSLAKQFLELIISKSFDQFTNAPTKNVDQTSILVLMDLHFFSER
jgi:hypothetical protein